MTAYPRSSTRLRRLFPGAQYLPPGSDPELASVRLDAGAVLPGEIYVHTDEFDLTGLEVAADRGASAILTEHATAELASPQVIVEDARSALRTLTRALESTPKQTTLVAVTGASGSESVANLAAAVLATSCEPVGLRTESCEDDGETCVARTPGSRQGAAAWLERCGLGGVSYAIAQAIPIADCYDLHTADLVCLTSLRCDGRNAAGQVEWKSSAAHHRALLRATGPIEPRATLVINADDPDCCRFASNHAGRLTTFGESDSADVRIAAIEEHTGGQSVVLTAGVESACVDLPSPGRAARRDAAAAVAIALELGLDLSTACAGLSVAPGTKLGMERVVAGQRFTVWLDQAARPTDLADALSAAKSAATGRVLAVVRLADDRSVAMEQLAIADRLADRVLVHGGPALAEAELPPHATFVEDRLGALAVALGLADDGDAVLIAGCDAHGATDPTELPDRDAVTELLRERLHCEDRRAAA